MDSMMGSVGVGQVGGAIWVRWTQLHMLLSHSRVAKILGGCCAWRCWRKAWKAASRACDLESPGQCRTWLVSSQSWPHLKHWPSVVLAKVWRRRRVGRRSFMYFDNWIHWPMDRGQRALPRGCQAMESKVAASHLESRLVAWWEHWMR